MNQLAAVPNLGLPSDARFLSWLDERGLTEDVFAVVSTLKRYFPDGAIRVELAEDDDSLDEVMVIVRTDETGDPYGHAAMATLAQFNDEWYLMQGIDFVLRVSVHLE